MSWSVVDSITFDVVDVDRMIVRVRWDDRVWTAAPVLCFALDAQSRVAPAVTVSQPGQAGVAEYEARLSADAAVTVRSPLRGRDLFPDDSIDDVVPPSMEVEAIHADGTVETASMILGQSAVVEGVSASALIAQAAWAAVATSDDGVLVYRAPAFVRIRNDGPGEGGEWGIEVRSDARFSAEPVLTGDDDTTVGHLAGAALSHALTGDLRVSTATLPAAPVGAELALSLAWRDYTLPNDATAALAASIRVMPTDTTTSPNRTGPAQLECRHESVPEALFPQRDVARWGMG